MYYFRGMMEYFWTRNFPNWMLNVHTLGIWILKFETISSKLQTYKRILLYFHVHTYWYRYRPSDRNITAEDWNFSRFFSNFASRCSQNYSNTNTWFHHFVEHSDFFPNEFIFQVIKFLYIPRAPLPTPTKKILSEKTAFLKNRSLHTFFFV